MQVEANEGELLDARSIYKAVNIFNGEISYYIDNNVAGFPGSEFNFEAFLIGSGALAVHADKRGIDYRQILRILISTRM